MRDAVQAAAARKKMKMHQKVFAKTGRQGESDRKIVTAKPKHLYAGKRKQGTANRR